MAGMTVQQHVRNRDDGFSLIEVLVAMIVVVPAVIGAAGMVTLAACAIRDARLESTAVVLASQKLEQLRALEWNADDVNGGPASSDTTTDLTRRSAGRWRTRADARRRRERSARTFRASWIFWTPAGDGWALAPRLRRARRSSAGGP